MTIGSTSYFILIWAVLLLWGFSIAGLAIGGLLMRKWPMIAVACAIAAAGFYLNRVILDAVFY